MQKFSKEEKILRQIEIWEKKHLRSHTKVNYGLTFDLIQHDDLNTEYRKLLVTKDYYYVSDTSRRFQLMGFGETVKSWLTEASRSITVFRERHAMRSRLSKEQRDDTLYDRMEQVYYGFMAQFLHAISFFQYDRIANEAYRTGADQKIKLILGKANALLEYYGSYLSLQGASAFVQPDDEIAGIRVAVESMQEALRFADNA